MAYADKLRKSRESIQSKYMEYNSIRQKKPKAFIAFLEGYDAPYYLPIIITLTGLEAEQIICGNKRKVIAIHDSLKEKGVLKRTKTGFFIDRDFDDNSILKDRLDYFITKGYSVENYYCTKESFVRILNSHMHYNCAHKDYDAILENYVVLQRQFNDAILEFNSWYCCIKRNNIIVDWSLDEKMPKDYVKIDIPNFKIDKNYSMATIHGDFPLKSQPTKEDINWWSGWIAADSVGRIRGKYEFSFLIEYLRSLPQIVNNPAAGFDDHPMNFSMGQKDSLSALAQYADRDDNLRDYILKCVA